MVLKLGLNSLVIVFLMATPVLLFASDEVVNDDREKLFSPEPSLVNHCNPKDLLNCRDQAAQEMSSGRLDARLTFSKTETHSELGNTNDNRVGVRGTFSLPSQLNFPSNLKTDFKLDSNGYDIQTDLLSGSYFVYDGGTTSGGVEGSFNLSIGGALTASARKDKALGYSQKKTFMLDIFRVELSGGIHDKNNGFNFLVYAGGSAGTGPAEIEFDNHRFDGASRFIGYMGIKSQLGQMGEFDFRTSNNVLERNVVQGGSALPRPPEDINRTSKVNSVSLRKIYGSNFDASISQEDLSIASNYHGDESRATTSARTITVGYRKSF